MNSGTRSPISNLKSQITNRPPLPSIDEAFGPGGLLTKNGYLFRREQLDYALAVGRIISRDGVGIVEGGTGVGKTLGYLIPHLLEILRSGGRLLIATRTKNLQDQVFFKDLPFLAGIFGFKYALLKGRENYICKDRLAEASDRSDLFRGEPYHRAIRYLERFDALHATGDLEAASRFVRRYGAEGRSAIADVRATDDTCTSDHRNACRHYRALAEAEKASVIVANHHLALYWPETYPEVSRVVIDEAHALEEAATDVYGPRFSVLFLRTRLRRLYAHRRKTTGILARLSTRERAEFGVDPILAEIASISFALTRFEETCRFVEPEDAALRRRIRDAELATPEWTELCNEAETLCVHLESLSHRLLNLFRALEPVERLKPTAERVQKAGLGLDEFARWGREIFRPTPVEGTVLWREASKDRPVIHRRSPLEIGPTLREKMLKRFSSVLLTSATMQACGDFAFLSERLGLTRATPPEQEGVTETAEEDSEWTARLVEPVAAGHPFDYAARVLLCLVRPEKVPTSRVSKTGPTLAAPSLEAPGTSDMETRGELIKPPAHPDLLKRTIDPTPGAGDSLADRIGRIAEVTQGRMLALFTNRARMLEAAEQLSLDGIEVLAQGRDGSRHELARRLRRRNNVLLLGTRSFWEGIDIPGENLSVVAMEKIPFVSPGEPVYEARCEAIGEKWFMRYALPLAMLALRQGFGRLIRTEEDRGVVVILDPGRRSYAGKIRKTLPECRTVEGPFEEVLEEIRAWWGAKP